MVNHYATLGVSRDANDADIKKAYRKEALKWHPDKNPDQKDLAEKRFKEVSEAFKVLSDPDERAHYDRYGEARQQGVRPRGPGGHQRAGPMYADELTPEDIFNMFFGVAPGTQRRRPQQHHQHGGGQQVNINLVQLLPLLLLMLFSLLSSVSTGDEKPFNLKRSESHFQQRRTEVAGVQYWVSDTFELFYPTGLALRKVEDQIENDNLHLVRRRCNAEVTQRQKMVEAAKQYSGTEKDKIDKMDAAISSYEMPNCNERDRLNAMRR